MYEAPIEIMKCVENVIKEENEFIENEVYQRVLKVGVNVDKEELIKALKYDREQYNKGYADGIKEGARLFAIMFCESMNISKSGIIQGILKEMGCEDERKID